MSNPELSDAGAAHAAPVDVRDSSVGLYGVRISENNKNAIESDYISNIAGIIRPLTEVMVKFIFEVLKAKEVYGETLSYNLPSQKVIKLVGMRENGIYSCRKDYKKDSYILKFILTEQDYNKIKEENNGVYKLSKINERIAPKEIHSKARHLDEAIKEFELQKQIIKANYCKKLNRYLKSNKLKYTKI